MTGLQTIRKLALKVQHHLKSHRKSHKLGREIISVLPRDAIASISRPAMTNGRGARRQMAPEEAVLGVEINGEARAYPLNVLAVHQVVCDMAGEEPVAATW